MDENQLIQPEPAPKRPVALTVLCILTFISSGLGILGCLFTPLMADMMIEMLRTTPGYSEMLNEQAMMVLKAGWPYYLTLLLLTSGSLTGALMMWNLKKNGFHFYTISNILIYCLPSFMLGIDFNIIGLVFPGIFMGLYAMNLKFMR